MNNATTNFDILITRFKCSIIILIVQQNYFSNLYPAKVLDLSAKLFFPCSEDALYLMKNFPRDRSNFGRDNNFDKLSLLLTLLLTYPFMSNAFMRILCSTSIDVIWGSTLNLRYSGWCLVSHFWKKKNKRILRAIIC